MFHQSCFAQVIGDYFGHIKSTFFQRFQNQQLDFNINQWRSNNRLLEKHDRDWILTYHVATQYSILKAGGRVLFVQMQDTLGNLNKWVAWDKANSVSVSTYTSI